MALPVQNVPVYNVKIPSTKEEFKFRPFLVKEQKALLLAQQSEDVLVMVDTLKAVINGCAKTKVDVDKLAVFDLEYMFSQIRAKSVGENVELFFFCDTCEDERAKVKITIDLTKIQVEFDPNHQKKIHLFGDVGLLMKYPTINVIKNLENYGSSNDVDLVFDIITECIEYIYDGEQIYYSKEQTKEELADFVNNLTAEQFNKIEEFFDTLPKLQQKVSYKCPVCQKEHNKSLEGLNNFF
jgi:hypothetical protein